MDATIAERLLRRPACRGCLAPGITLCLTCARALAAPPPPPPPGVDRLLAPLRYEGAARDLVLSLKLRGDRAAAAPLVAALGSAVVASGLAATALTWVPGRRADVRRRGFDHAEVLARSLARALGLPARALLVRGVARPDQAALGSRERWANLSGAFVARVSPPEVAVVDDLVTTGATAGACAEALRAAGAAGVEVLAACHRTLQ